MSKFAAGVALSAAVLAVAFALGVVEVGGGACASRCGEGTTCVDDLCVSTPVAPVAVVEPVAAEEDRRAKRRKRGRGSALGDSERDDDAQGDFVAVDDSRVPRFDRAATKTLDLEAGSERLSDRVVNDELAKLDRSFEGCVRVAAEHSDAPIRGRLSYELGIAGSGRVTGVNVEAPASVDVFGIVPCVRKAIFAHRFPEFDGPTMGVDGSFVVD